MAKEKILEHVRAGGDLEATFSNFGSVNCDLMTVRIAFGEQVGVAPEGDPIVFMRKVICMPRANAIALAQIILQEDQKRNEMDAENRRKGN